MTKFLAPVLVAFPLLGAVGTQAAIAASNNARAVFESPSHQTEDSAIVKVAEGCATGYFRDGNGDCRYYVYGKADRSASYFMAPLVQQPSPVPGQVDAPRFVGPYQLHDGLLPNGLTPNPPTYG